MSICTEKVHPDVQSLQQHFRRLKLPFMLESFQALAQTAVDKHWSHLEYLSELVNAETAAHNDRHVQRCIRQAKFPVLKTLNQFNLAYKD